MIPIYILQQYSIKVFKITMKKFQSYKYNSSSNIFMKWFIYYDLMFIVVFSLSACLWAVSPTKIYLFLKSLHKTIILFEFPKNQYPNQNKMWTKIYDNQIIICPFLFQDWSHPSTNIIPQAKALMANIGLWVWYFGW